MNQSILINLSVIFSKPTGISTYILNILPHLKSLNPILLTDNPIDGFNCYPIPNKMTSEQGVKGHLRRLFWTQIGLPRIYKNLNAVGLFSPLPEASLYTNCQFVVMVHDLIPLRFPNPFSPLTSYFRYYVPEVLRQARHIVCNSQATAKDIIEFYNIPETKITPIPLAYDKNHFRLIEIDSNANDKPYFLYLGRPNPYKNLPRLIDAFAALPNYRDYQLWIAGPYDKRHTPQLLQQVKERGLNEQVKFLDYVSYDELPLILNQALALVFPSLWEGFGLPVLEAMACGTPVITSNLSSLPEVVGEAALLVNPYITEEITAAMNAIINDNELRSHLRFLGLERANQFSWEKTGKATLEVLQQI